MVVTQEFVDEIQPLVKNLFHPVESFDPPKSITVDGIILNHADYCGTIADINFYKVPK